MFETVSRIIVPTDGMPERRNAGVVAAAIARRLGCGVELVSTAPTDDVTDRLDLLRNEVAQIGGNVGVDVIGASDAEHVVRRLLEDAGTLVCLPSSGQMAIADAAKKSMSAAVLEHADRPVLVVGPMCRPAIEGSVLAIALDGTHDAEHIIGPAVELARRLGLTPTLFQVIEPSGDAGGPDATESGYLRNLAAEAGRDVDFDVLHDRRPTRALERLAESPEVALLATASHGYSSAERLIAPSVTHALVRHAPCPLLVGLRRPSQDQHPAAPTGPRVVVGVQRLDNDIEALTVAIDEATTRNAELQVVHVWGPSWFFDDQGVVQREPLEAARAAGEALAGDVTRAVRDRAPELTVSTWLADGFVGDVLVAAARHAEVIVIGEHQYGVVEDLLFGHVADGVVARTPVPVIVVPEPPAEDQRPDAV